MGSKNRRAARDETDEEFRQRFAGGSSDEELTPNLLNTDLFDDDGNATLVDDAGAPTDRWKRQLVEQFKDDEEASDEYKRIEEFRGFVELRVKERRGPGIEEINEIIRLLYAELQESRIELFRHMNPQSFEGGIVPGWHDFPVMLRPPPFEEFARDPEVQKQGLIRFGQQLRDEAQLLKSTKTGKTGGRPPLGKPELRNLAREHFQGLLAEGQRARSAAKNTRNWLLREFSDMDGGSLPSAETIRKWSVEART